MVYVGDFETTVLGTKEQDYTEVWASAIVPLYTEDVVILHSIADTYSYLKELVKTDDVVIYYHNLKFDGSFWLDYLIRVLNLRQAIQYIDATHTKFEWQKDADMFNNTFKYSISDMGQFYSITIRVHGHFIKIRDSLKLLPFSVKKIGDSFKTKHKKLDMEYTGLRFAGCEIAENDKKYIRNDVLVVKEALEIMFSEGHDKLTIGSCCMAEFKNIIGKNDYNVLFPDMTTYELQEEYEYPNADRYIRKSYKGGWCYLVKGAENKKITNGVTADVNSLYPSMMHSESGNIYPYGKPTFWSGNYIPDKAIGKNKYYFVRIKTRFYLKKGMLPFIQIKGNLLYKSTEMLETSDIYDKITGEYYRYYYDSNGNLCDTAVTLTLTMTDYELIKEHYELVDFEILDGCYFFAMSGIFDDYINKYAELKKKSVGALRELAKLFLNNLYGKLASSDDSSFKYAYLKDDGTIGFQLITEHNKKTAYIPCGSAITSYARAFTIRAAQKNFYGADKRGFKYADTDSIHCDLDPKEIKGIKVHDKNFCCWKLESSWDNAFFVRQKTYIEHVIAENLEAIEEPYYNIKCAGMNKGSKKIVDYALRNEDLTDKEKEDINKMSDDAKKFIDNGMDLEDFTYGLEVPENLKAKRIKGGVLLINNVYKMLER